MFYFCFYAAATEPTLEHADDVEQLKKLRQLGGEGTSNIFIQDLHSEAAKPSM